MDLVLANQSTIVFANSRRLAERLTARLNEIYAERQLLAAGGGWTTLAPARRTSTPYRAAAAPMPSAACRPAARRAAHVHRHAGPHDGPGRQHRRRRSRAGPRPPRLRVQGPARPDRGRPEIRPAALRRGHVLPGARHRHGRRGPRGAGRVAAVGGQRPAAGGPRRPPGRRSLPGRPVPQAPGRSGPHGHHRGADARRQDRAAQRAGQPAGHPGPADRRRHRPGRHRRGGMVRHGPAVGAVRLAPPLRVRGHPGPAGRALPLGRIRRTAAPGHLGPERRDHRGPARRAAARRHLRRHHPGPRAVRRLHHRHRGRGHRRFLRPPVRTAGQPARPPPQPRAGAGWANSTRKWSTSPGSATSSPSAPPAGRSRTSRTTASWSRRRSASPASSRSGRATPSAGRWTWAAPSARSCANWRRPTSDRPPSAARPAAWTTSPRTT